MDEYPRLRIAGIEPESFVDGPGIRLTVFTQGCHHHCPGCQNPQTHDFEGGHFIEREAIITMIKENPLLDGVTFSGGDPMDQAAALIPLAREIKGKQVKALGLNIVTFTGYTFEHLYARKDENPGWADLLEVTDYLIDGPFVEELRSLELRFRGSSNQRIIDVQKSLIDGHVVLHQIQLDEMAEHPDREYST